MIRFILCSKKEKHDCQFSTKVTTIFIEFGILFSAIFRVSVSSEERKHSSANSLNCRFPGYNCEIGKSIKKGQTSAVHGGKTDLFFVEEVGHMMWLRENMQK